MLIVPVRLGALLPVPNAAGAYRLAHSICRWSSLFDMPLIPTIWADPHYLERKALAQAKGSHSEGLMQETPFYGRITASLIRAGSLIASVKVSALGRHDQLP